jgi:hypothetical protein
MRRLKMLICTAVVACVPVAYAAEPLVVAEFPSAGVERVVLRAGGAEQATVIVAGATGSVPIRVSGIASGGSKGYHSPDPAWKETPAAEWGMEFVAKRFGSTLVVSSKNEIRYIHHHYAIEGLRLELPTGIALIRERRNLDGDGLPDLVAP